MSTDSTSLSYHLRVNRDKPGTFCVEGGSTCFSLKRPSPFCYTGTWSTKRSPSLGVSVWILVRASVQMQSVAAQRRVWDFSCSSSGVRLIGAAYCLLAWKPWRECPQGVGWALSDCLENGCAQKEQLCTVKTPTIQGCEICDETQEQPAVLCVMFLLCWGRTLGLMRN